MAGEKLEQAAQPSRERIEREAKATRVQPAQACTYELDESARSRRTPGDGRTKSDCESGDFRGSPESVSPCTRQAKVPVQ